MRNFDFSPLYRSAIGFDRMVNMLKAGHGHGNDSYPPYNIELVSENQYRIAIEVAGFTESELEITTHDNLLTVKGAYASNKNERHYLYQGIVERNFERKFQLDEHIQIKDAQLKNGILFIYLERVVPETLKPRRIEIK